MICNNCRVFSGNFTLELESEWQYYMRRWPDTAVTIEKVCSVTQGHHPPMYTRIAAVMGEVRGGGRSTSAEHFFPKMVLANDGD